MRPSHTWSEGRAERGQFGDPLLCWLRDGRGAAGSFVADGHPPEMGLRTVSGDLYPGCARLLGRRNNLFATRLSQAEATRSVGFGLVLSSRAAMGWRHLRLAKQSLALDGLNANSLYATMRVGNQGSGHRARKCLLSRLEKATSWHRRAEIGRAHV